MWVSLGVLPASSSSPAILNLVAAVTWSPWQWHSPIRWWADIPTSVLARCAHGEVLLTIFDFLPLSIKSGFFIPLTFKTVYFYVLDDFDSSFSDVVPHHLKEVNRITLLLPPSQIV